MTQFDGSTGPSAATGFTAVATESNGQPVLDKEAEGMRFGAAADETPSSMLDLLRDRVESRESEETEPWVHEIPALGLRLVCDPRIDNADYQRWMKASLPRGRGARNRQFNGMDIDTLALSARAITHTNLRVEVQNKDKFWIPITDGTDPTPLSLDDSAMLRTFNVMDSISLLRKLFGRDAALINAGQALLAEAGYLDADVDDPE